MFFARGAGVSVHLQWSQLFPFTSSGVVNVASQPVNVLRGPPLNNPVFRWRPVLRTAFTSGQSACGRLDSASMPRFALFRHPGGITLSSFLRFTGLTRTGLAASSGVFCVVLSGCKFCVWSVFLMFFAEILKAGVGVASKSLRRAWRAGAACRTQAERREAGGRLGAVPEQAAGVSRMSAKRRFCRPQKGVGPLPPAGAGRWW
ncbi:hypothetical protein DES37_110192 [Mangrovibacter plantisponsor]|uniref:Uncharacterized protein n=1 Tax=Mangrovibacter plantisponsor TaxID=451513 RepID=A0A317Q183_9ENTR|nr:hypothetical protein DES37_110192 [Mangrovibacter plantisponsor]